MPDGQALEHNDTMERSVILMINITRGPCRAKRKKRPGERLQLFLVEDTCCSGSNTGTTEIISQESVTEKRRILGPKHTADLMQLLKDEAAERPDLRPLLTEAASCLIRGDIDGFNMAFTNAAVIRYKVAPGG